MPNPNQVLYRYVCSGCKSILKETPVEISASPSELCPQCGALLSDTLERKDATTKRQQHEPMYPLKTALDFAAPRFGIPKLDELVECFARSICLIGERFAESLFWRAIVRSLVSRRAGGSGFSKVLLIDAGNCSDIYLCVDYARQFGLNLEKLLDGIIVTRAFTVYQLAALAKEVHVVARRYEVDLIAMADMASMFVTDPLMQKEESRLAIKIAQSLTHASNQVPVMAFVSSFNSPDWVSGFDSRIEVKKGQGTLLLSAFSVNAGRSSAIHEREIYRVHKEA